jgi:glycine oxidase
MSQTSGDVVIIGGGIVGCACAYELAKAGASVTLLEYGKTGMQATNAAAGMLAPFTETHTPDALMQMGGRALREYPAVVEELEAACGFDVEYRQQGILNVAFDDEQAAELRRRYAWQGEMGITLAWMDAAMCREMEPRLSEHVVAGVFSPTEATVSNQLVALAFERAAIAQGAVIRQRSPVVRAERLRGRVTAVIAGEDRVEGDTFVLAAGARSGQIGRKLGLSLPVFPVRGQMIALGGMSTPISRPVWGPDGYLVPRANGLVFAGATVEDVGFRRKTTKAGVARMRRMASALVPQLSAAQVHFEWAGLRPGTADAMPIIGPVTGTNVVAATGHYRNGILLGPMTGRLVAQGITTGAWDEVPNEFAPERFGAEVTP